MCVRVRVRVRVREPRTDFRLSPFPSPSTSHPIPTSSYLRLRYTCIRRWTLLGQLLDPAWIDCESRPPVSCSCIPFLSRASYAWVWTAPSLWAARHITSRRLPHGEHLR